MQGHEFDLIQRIRRRLEGAGAGIVLGIGDDAALLRVPAGSELVACVDTLVAGVHFPPGTPPAAIGWKALAVNLSDLAAMGATPRWFTLALTLPAVDPAWTRGFISGLRRLAVRQRIALVGGDTTRGPLSITIQALGLAPAGSALRREGARAGDAVFVSGALGDAAAGLAIVQQRAPPAGIGDARTLRRRLDLPTPRVELGLALRGVASACIDVSDGLAQDLGHLLRPATLGARIDVTCLPISPALRRAVPQAHARQQLALSGGDDYELCFTVPPRRLARVAPIARALRLRLTRVGTICVQPGLHLHDAGGAPVALSATGFDHFA